MFIDMVIQRLSTVAARGDEAAVQCLSALKEAERFHTNNIADYIHTTFLPEVDGPLDFDVPNEIPNIAPLAPTMWFEMSGDLWERTARIQMGCLFIVVYDTKEDGVDQTLPEGTRWVVGTILFVNEGESFLRGDISHVLAIGFDGKPLHVKTERSPFCSEEQYQRLIERNSEARNLNPCIWTALFAICFCHCKNITIEAEKVSRQVRRAAERSKEPVVTFKTINIHPVKKVMTEEGQVESRGLKRALHICRAHFAHYTEEHPLFGKYTGTFYRHMHLRGSLKEGAVIKDYNIHEK
jgi:hypothetical protein